MRFLSILTLLSAPLAACAVGQASPHPVGPLTETEQLTETQLCEILDGENRARVGAGPLRLELRDPFVGPDGLGFSEVKSEGTGEPFDSPFLPIQQIDHVDVYRPQGTLGAILGAAGGWIITDLMLGLFFCSDNQECDREPTNQYLAADTRWTVNAVCSVLWAGMGFRLGRTRFAWRPVFPRR